MQLINEERHHRDLALLAGVTNYPQKMIYSLVASSRRPQLRAVGDGTRSRGVCRESSQLEANVTGCERWNTLPSRFPTKPGHHSAGPTFTLPQTYFNVGKTLVGFDFISPKISALRSAAVKLHLLRPLTSASPALDLRVPSRRPLSARHIYRLPGPSTKFLLPTCKVS